MLGFRFPEITRRRQFGDRLSWPKTGCIDIGDRIDCGFPLRVRDIVDGRPITYTPVIPLPVQCCWIMYLEEELQKRPIACFLRIKNNLDSLGVGAMIAVGSIRHISSRITDAR